jgi:hypothetical protein
MKVDGACHCGSIRYEAEADPAKVVICHCTDCQTLSDSAFYVKTAESGSRREQTFCPDCGTPIYSGPEGGGKVWACASAQSARETISSQATSIGSARRCPGSRGCRRSSGGRSSPSSTPRAASATTEVRVGPRGRMERARPCTQSGTALRRWQGRSPRPAGDLTPRSARRKSAMSCQQRTRTICRRVLDVQRDCAVSGPSDVMNQW